MDSLAQITEGETIGVWLPKELRKVFRRHVGVMQGAAGRFGVDAVREKLQREGAFAAGSTVAAINAVKSLQPADVPVLTRLVELIASRGAAAVAAKLDELEMASLTEEGSRR